jgi:hypothetical protein
MLDRLNPLTIPDWDALVLNTPGTGFFHTSAWCRVLSESYGYKPVYFAEIEGDRFRTLVPMMEIDSFLTGKRGVSLPFTDYCDPIIEGLANSVIPAEAGIQKDGARFRGRVGNTQNGGPRLNDAPSRGGEGGAECSILHSAF